VTGWILVLAGSYGLVAALLCWLLIASRAHLAVKLLSTAATACLVVLSYVAIGELRGLPTDAPPPPFFKLHWARIVEPNPLMKEPGHIFLWLEALDAENYPSGHPRAYQLPYDPDLVRKVEVAMGKIQDGEEVAGTISDSTTEIADTAEELAGEAVEGATQKGPSANQIGDRGYQFDPSSLTFGTAPAPITPEKPTN
jgi:hypothetical protein